MELHEISIEDFKPGIKFLTLAGREAEVSKANPSLEERYGSTNGATYDGDDHWFFFDVIGDEWDGHGFYHSHIPKGLKVIK